MNLIFPTFVHEKLKYLDFTQHGRINSEKTAKKIENHDEYLKLIFILEKNGKKYHAKDNITIENLLFKYFNGNIQTLLFNNSLQEYINLEIYKEIKESDIENFTLFEDEQTFIYKQENSNGIFHEIVDVVLKNIYQIHQNKEDFVEKLSKKYKIEKK